MLMGLSEQEMASTLETLEGNMYSRGWGVNPIKTQDACHTSNVFRGPVVGAFWDIPSKERKAQIIAS